MPCARPRVTVDDAPTTAKRSISHSGCGRRTADQTREGWLSDEGGGGGVGCLYGGRKTHKSAASGKARVFTGGSAVSEKKMQESGWWWWRDGVARCVWFQPD